MTEESRFKNEAQTLWELQHPAKKRMYISLNPAQVFQLKDELESVYAENSRLKMKMQKYIADGKLEAFEENESDDCLDINLKSEDEIENLDLSVRSYNALKRCGIKYVYELLPITEEELLSVRNMGKRSAKEIMQKVKEYIGDENNE